MTPVLAGLALASQLAYLDALFWSSLGTTLMGHGSARPALLSSAVSGAFLALFSGILAVLMAFRTRGERGSYALSISLAAWSYILSYSGLMVLFGPMRSSAWRAPFDAHFLVVEALGLAGLLRFTADFPRPLTPGDLQGPGLLPPWLRPVQHLRRWLLRPAAPWLAGAGACLLAFGVNAAMGRAVQDAAFLSLVDLLRLSVLALVVLNVRRSFLSGTRADRDLVLWLVLGFALLMGAVGLLLGGNVLSAVTGWELPVLNWRPMVLDLGVLGLLWGAARGVSYRGGRRPDVLVRRVTVLSVMGALALFLAAGLESLLAGPRGMQGGLPRGAGTLVALVAVGVLYARTGRPLDGVLERAVADVAPPPAQG
ncbi:MAG: hypothetical protein PVJ02_04470 [Gemmatimonadota bacterium]